MTSDVTRYKKRTAIWVFINKKKVLESWVQTADYLRSLLIWPNQILQSILIWVHTALLLTVPNYAPKLHTSISLFMQFSPWNVLPCPLPIIKNFPVLSRIYFNAIFPDQPFLLESNQIKLNCPLYSNTNSFIHLLQMYCL